MSSVSLFRLMAAILNHQNDQRLKEINMSENKEADYTPSHIANFFLDKAEEENIPITQMKLQKLVYIGYGWVLAVLNQKLFDEPIEAWTHGPVIPSLYHEFKHYRADHISHKSGIFNIETLEYIEPRIPSDESDIMSVLDKVWFVYKQLSAIALRNKTHEPKTPWECAYNGDGVINDDDIKSHFHRKIREYLNA